MHFSLSVILTFAWALLPSTFADFNFSNTSSAYTMKVVIDAGHGGKDGGCVGAPHNEKDIVLNIALELGRMIETQLTDVEVIYTREDDEFVALDKRAQMANKAKADLFISIHANSLPALKSLRGSETYVMGLDEARANLAVAKRENAAIFMEKDYKTTYQGYDPNSAEGHIMLSMFQNIHLEKSIEFAQLVEEAVAIHAHGHSRGVKQAGFLVLRATNMPSVLVESGYLTNEADNEYLQTEAGQTAIAYSIFDALKKYKANQENGSGFAVVAEPKVTPILVKQTEVIVPNNIEKESLVIPYAEEKESTFVPELEEPAGDVINYRVQLAASKTPLKNYTGRWKAMASSIEEKKEGSYFKYLSRAVNNLEEGKILLSSIRSKGFDTAFLVAYKDGKRVKIVK